MSIGSVISELQLFSSLIISKEKPVDIAKITDFESKYKLSLPNDYKFFLTHFNGINLAGTETYGIFEADVYPSLESVYIFEHHEVGNPMPDYLIPFSPDGGGNHYCFDTRYINAESCNIVFWQHDYNYSTSDFPELTHKTFASWVKEIVIDWTLEEYDHSGNEKLT